MQPFHSSFAQRIIQTDTPPSSQLIQKAVELLDYTQGHLPSISHISDGLRSPEVKHIISSYLMKSADLQIDSVEFDDLITSFKKDLDQNPIRISYGNTSTSLDSVFGDLISTVQNLCEAYGVTLKHALEIPEIASHIQSYLIQASEQAWFGKMIEIPTQQIDGTLNASEDYIKQSDWLGDFSAEIENTLMQFKAAIRQRMFSPSVRKMDTIKLPD